MHYVEISCIMAAEYAVGPNDRANSRPSSAYILYSQKGVGGMGEATKYYWNQKIQPSSQCPLLPSVLGLCTSMNCSRRIHRRTEHTMNELQDFVYALCLSLIHISEPTRPY